MKMIATSAAAAMIVMMIGELIELLRERCLLLLDAAEHVRDVADLGGHARSR